MKTCGNCAYFVRIKGWGSGRNGLCSADDCGTHSDNSAARLKCRDHTPLKYDRKKDKRITGM